MDLDFSAGGNSPGNYDNYFDEAINVKSVAPESTLSEEETSELEPKKIFGQKTLTVEQELQLSMMDVPDDDDIEPVTLQAPLSVKSRVAEIEGELESSRPSPPRQVTLKVVNTGVKTITEDPLLDAIFPPSKTDKGQAISFERKVLPPDDLLSFPPSTAAPRGQYTDHHKKAVDPSPPELDVLFDQKADEKKKKIINMIKGYMSNFAELLGEICGVTPKQRHNYLYKLHQMDLKTLEIELDSIQYNVRNVNSQNIVKMAYFTTTSICEGLAPTVDMDLTGFTQALKRNPNIDNCMKDIAVTYGFDALGDPLISLALITAATAINVDQSNKMRRQIEKENEAQKVAPPSTATSSSAPSKDEATSSPIEQTEKEDIQSTKPENEQVVLN